jgi:hypoxanthine phosphoribosyltransferase
MTVQKDGSTIAQRTIASRPGGGRPGGGRVVTLGPAAFRESCRELLEVASQDGMPDVVVGIRTGGLHVAQAMADFLPPGTPVLSVTCRRPSTRAKQKMPLLRPALRHLPQPIADALRLIEHYMFTARRRPDPRRTLELDQVELMELAATLAVHPAASNLLVVDDAVDSGLTMKRVLEAVRNVAPATMTIRSAAITVTLPTAAVQPDYALYRGTLCRFPWSMDAAIA